MQRFCGGLCLRERRWGVRPRIARTVALGGSGRAPPAAVDAVELIFSSAPPAPLDVAPAAPAAVPPVAAIPAVAVAVRIFLASGLSDCVFPVDRPPSDSGRCCLAMSRICEPAA